MSEGSIKTPVGNFSPEKRVYDNQSMKQLPGAAGSKPIPAGLNIFSFNGQEWKLHPFKGINWQIIILSGHNQKFSLSQWTTTWQNSLEQAEFRESNGKPYEEAQQYFRLNSNEPVFACIIPFFKSKGEPYKLQQTNANLSLDNGSENILIGKTGYRYAAMGRIILSAFANKSFQADGYAIDGGPAELEINEKQLVIRVHGKPGSRNFLLPGLNYFPGQSAPDLTIKKEGNNSRVVITYNHKEEGLLSSEKGYSEWKIKIGK